MRLTASQLRNAVTDPNYRLPTGPKGGGPTTDAAFRNAIRVYHAAGLDAARDSLRASLKHKYWRSGRGLTMARVAMTNLDAYDLMAAGDGRTAFAGKSLSLTLGDDTIVTNVDVILIDDVGYTGRTCIQGPLASPLTKSQRDMLAAPAVLALGAELEDSLEEEEVVGVEVWELRSGSSGTVTRSDAIAAVDALRNILDRLR